LTTQTQIHIKIEFLSGELTGGSPITSYVISWNKGTGEFEDLFGSEQSNLSDDFITLSVTSGSLY
jgi:hypothetical protein